MPHFFISYAKKDTRKLALELEAALNALPDVTAWVDRSLKAGRSWEIQIETEIRRCDYMLVLYSPDMNRHQRGEDESYMLSEIHYAKRIARKPIIPVMAQSTEPPMSLVMEQYIDFTLPDLNLNDLIIAICQEVGIPVGSGFIPTATPTVSASPHIEFPATPPAPIEPTPGTHMTDDKDVEMVYVPAGKFMMGSNNGNDDEKPIHEVLITHPFWIDLTPVTNVAYGAFIKDGGYQNRFYWTKLSWNWLQAEMIVAPEDYEGFSEPQQPRVGISWYEAFAYARWRGGRLPTEAEWEWAARGPENPIYPWGNIFDANHLIYGENSGGKTDVVGADVRLSGASWVGVLDMTGNVWEWGSSLYKSYPFDVKDGRENIEDTGNRILRGASWPSDQVDARSTYRINYRPSLRSLYLGFRIVRSHSNS